MKQETTTDVFRNVTGLSIGLAILMIVAGFLAIVRPFAAGIGVSIFVGALIVLSGLLYLAYAFTGESAGSIIWRVLIGVFYLVGGFYLLVNPEIALQSLTLVVAILLIAEGVLRMVGYFQVRSVPGSGWILFDGLVTLVLGIAIAYPWPDSSGWAIGTLVGIDLLFSGFTRLMYSMAARKVVNAATR